MDFNEYALAKTLVTLPVGAAMVFDASEKGIDAFNNAVDLASKKDKNKRYQHEFRHDGYHIWRVK